MSSWRPDNWPKNPCDGCTSKREDDWGLICDMACGNYTRYRHFERGADAMLETLKKEHPCYVNEGNVASVNFPLGFVKGYFLFIPDDEAKK